VWAVSSGLSLFRGWLVLPPLGKDAVECAYGAGVTVVVSIFYDTVCRGGSWIVAGYGTGGRFSVEPFSRIWAEGGHPSLTI